MRLTSQQSNKIQIARGLAIIAVVFIHNTPSGLAQVFCRPFLNFCVGLFLFISGLMSTASNQNPKKRIIKVLIPYFIWTLIYSIMYNIDNLTNIPIAFFKNIITAKACAPMYYVFVYCTFTLLIPLIDKLAKSRYKYWGFIIAPIEIIFMRSIPLVVGMEIHSYIRIVMSVSCLGWFTYFYLGYLIGNNLIRLNISHKKLYVFWSLSIIAQICEGLFYHIQGDANAGTQLKLTSLLAGAFFCLVIYNYINSDSYKNIKVLKLLGDNSFGIYFSHIAVMNVLSHIPFYSTIVPYPINAMIVLLLNIICIYIGKKILGKYSKYLAL